MPDHALELTFGSSSMAAVVAQWEALRAAGLPSQADHRSMTNAPHLTLVAAVGVEEAVVQVARETVGPLPPARIVLRGLVLFGQGPRVTIAHLVEPDQTLAAAAARRRDHASGGGGASLGARRNTRLRCRRSWMWARGPSTSLVDSKPLQQPVEPAHYRKGSAGKPWRTPPSLPLVQGS